MGAKLPSSMDTSYSNLVEAAIQAANLGKLGLSLEDIQGVEAARFSKAVRHLSHAGRHPQRHREL